MIQTQRRGAKPRHNRLPLSLSVADFFTFNCSLLGYKRTSRGRPNETNNRLGKFYDFQKA
jgi:hypothetical protein